MSKKTKLPLRLQLLYAVGQLGWATLTNIIGLQLVYFYIPPSDAGLPVFITQATFLVVLNAIVLVAASGRLLDAITDPLIASFSDRTENPKGKRIPFMRYGAIPAALFCFLMFLPPSDSSAINIVWLVIVQALFYIALTTYVTPYFALLPELSRDANDRLNLSTWISITFALGIVLAAQVPVIAGLFPFENAQSIQAAIALLCVIAALLMLVPVFTLDEKMYSDSEPSNVPMMAALRETFGNIHFRYYVIADFSYFTAITIISTGLLYYITVLLLQEEGLVGLLLTITVLLSFVIYPLVNVLAKRVGKKILVVGAFFLMSGVFALIYFLGNGIPLSNMAQAYLIVLVYAVPLAFLGVLPNAILADIATHDALETGKPKEGMYFAARTLAQKFGQTFGVLIFAMMTTFGKDIGNDTGIRLSGVVGFVLCFLAGMIFLRYQEAQVLSEIQTMEG